MIFCAVFAPYIAPQNPFDTASLDILDNNLPPVWLQGGDGRFLLGTDDQGRDIFSTIMYGARISLLVGFVSVIFAAFFGVGLGLISGYVGGRTDAIIMRIADVQLSFPAILIALLIDGLARNVIPNDLHDRIAILVIIVAISISSWVQYARTVRSSVMAERTKEYVQACHVMGLGNIAIMIRHILPNCSWPCDGNCNNQSGTRDYYRSNIEFFGSWGSSNNTKSWYAHSHRKPVSLFRRMVDYSFPRCRAGITCSFSKPSW